MLTLVKTMILLIKLKFLSSRGLWAAEMSDLGGKTMKLLPLRLLHSLPCTVCRQEGAKEEEPFSHALKCFLTKQETGHFLFLFFPNYLRRLKLTRPRTTITLSPVLRMVLRQKMTTSEANTQYTAAAVSLAQRRAL